MPDEASKSDEAVISDESCHTGREPHVVGALADKRDVF